MSAKLASVIRNYRKENELSQARLSNQIGITISYLSMIENENFDKLPKQALLSAIEFSLGLDVKSQDSDSVIDCQSLEVAALQDYRAAKILRAIQNREVPGALLGRMISILERGYD